MKSKYSPRLNNGYSLSKSALEYLINFFIPYLYGKNRFIYEFFLRPGHQSDRYVSHNFILISLNIKDNGTIIHLLYISNIILCIHIPLKINKMVIILDQIETLLFPPLLSYLIIMLLIMNVLMFTPVIQIHTFNV